ncbi:MAG TPA: hypothetical protein VF600_07495 [Abditibacteriaceae bacterium]
MRRFVSLFIVLVLCAATATAKRDRGSYISQYLSLSEQINATLETLQKDVLIACGEVKPKEAKPKREKPRQRRTKEEKANAKDHLAEKPKKELSPAELAALREELIAELAERVRPLRRRAERLREIGPVPAELRRANVHVQQYSRHIDAAVDALKQAAYSGKVNAAINAHISAAKADAAEAERAMGQYLDAKPLDAKPLDAKPTAVPVT